MIRHSLKLVISIFLFAGISYASEDTLRLVGTWEFGQIPQPTMKITRTTISEGICKNMPYDVIYRDGDVFYLSVKAPSQCYWLGAGGLFLQLTLYSNDEGMEVRTCFSLSELMKLREKPQDPTRCSWESAHRID